jgi:hypothetical protein
MQTRVVDAGVGDGATAVAAAAGVVMILSEKNVIPASLPASTRSSSGAEKMVGGCVFFSDLAGELRVSPLVEPDNNDQTYDERPSTVDRPPSTTGSVRDEFE